MIDDLGLNAAGKVQRYKKDNSYTTEGIVKAKFGNEVITGARVLRLDLENGDVLIIVLKEKAWEIN